ncbi:MAG: DMT family transporter [Myxococcales bacterium]|nr:DMT family transporter [Myxococcales bacterium]
MAAVVMVPLAHGRRRANRRDAAKLAALGALLFATAWLTIFALARLSVALVLTIASLTPVAVALASREQGRRARFFAGVGCAVGGAVLATGLFDAATATNVIGVLCMLGAVATSTTYRLGLERVTDRHTPSVVSTWVFASGGLLALVVVTPLAGMPPAAAWWAGGWTGVAAAVANVGFVTVIEVFGAARASLWMLLQRPLVIAIAALWLGERPGPLQIAGIVAVLLGVWLGQTARRQTSAP